MLMRIRLVSSKGFCYEAKTVEAVSWSIFILRLCPSSLSLLGLLMGDIVTFFLIFVIALANRSQVLGWPNIWNDDIIDLPWFGEYPGYPGGPLYTLGPQLEGQVPHVQAGQMVVNGNLIPQQPGYSIIVWPGVNGEPPRVEQRPGIVTHSTLTL